MNAPCNEIILESSTFMDEDTNDSVEGEDQYVVEVKNCHKTYLHGIEGVAALRGVKLGVKRGEFVMLYGTSGGGKSTLLNLIGTIDRPTKGTIKICETLISDRTPDSELAELRLKRLGFVFQTFNLISQLTAIENVELPLTLQGDLSVAERRARCRQLLKSVGMEDRMYHLPSQLSGGEQQRVTIARALVNWPDLLLLDEPTGDLDTKNTELVLRMLVDLNKRYGITMIMVTHDIHLRNYADRIVHLRDGKIHREVHNDVGKREQHINELMNSGLGNQDGLTGLQEGTNGEAEVLCKDEISKRGVKGMKTRMTCIRKPAAYAMSEALLPSGSANGQRK